MNYYIITFLMGLVFGLLIKAKIGLNIDKLIIYDTDAENEELLNKIKSKVKEENKVIA